MTLIICARLLRGVPPCCEIIGAWWEPFWWKICENEPRHELPGPRNRFSFVVQISVSFQISIEGGAREKEEDCSGEKLNTAKAQQKRRSDDSWDRIEIYPGK